tara:strand:+ start:9 stop:563 length:555 start_codon:yes stop_codon:yes gene_type:complete
VLACIALVSTLVELSWDDGERNGFGTIIEVPRVKSSLCRLKFRLQLTNLANVARVNTQAHTSLDSAVQLGRNLSDRASVVRANRDKLIEVPTPRLDSLKCRGNQAIAGFQHKGRAFGVHIRVTIENVSERGSNVGERDNVARKVVGGVISKENVVCIGHNLFFSSLGAVGVIPAGSPIIADRRA